MFEEEAKPAKRRQVTLENCLGAVPVDDKKVNLIKGKLQLSKVYQNINPIVYQIVVLTGVLMILALCIINFSTYRINQQVLEFDSYIASRKELIELKDEEAKKLVEVNKIKSLIDNVPTGKEKAYPVLKCLIEAVNAVPGISITNGTLSGDKDIKITFSTPDSIVANDFDIELRNYFDFDRTFYNDNKKAFSLDLTLKDNI